MQHPLELQFLGLAPSSALEAIVRDKVSDLERRRPDLVSCRVTIESVHKHSQGKANYAVRVELAVPGRVLTVNRVQHEDAYVALREAFADARRQINDASHQPWPSSSVAAP